MNYDSHLKQHYKIFQIYKLNEISDHKSIKFGSKVGSASKIRASASLKHPSELILKFVVLKGTENFHQQQ